MLRPAAQPGDQARCQALGKGLGFVGALLLWGLAAACDHGLQAEPEGGPTGIAGRLTFGGPWPPEVGEVAVAVYEDLPDSVADLFALSGFDAQVALGTPEYEYFVPLSRDGVYRWIVVAWRRPDSFWDFNSLLGCYYVEGDTLPTPVPVTMGEVSRGIDIAVDFGVLRGETIPGQAVCRRALPAGLARISGGD